MKILVTGGAGYIGAHTCIELLENGYEVVVIDNLTNSSLETINTIAQITRMGPQSIVFYKGDVRDRELLIKIFKKDRIDAVIHFAGLKAVGESVDRPLLYYNNNVNGSIILFEEMRRAGVYTLVFSSSATVYGDADRMPISESFPTKAVNPYGRTKLIIEDILRDLSVTESQWKIGILRYFNPIGSHVSGLIGDNPQGIPNNIMPYISQVSVGKRSHLNVYGNDYKTKDGTGVRDYIHVVDLARGHIAILEKFLFNTLGNLKIATVNLGTGTGYSVFELIRMYEKISERKIPYKIDKRRTGDVAECYADTAYARELLDWEAEYDLKRMVEDVWRWQRNNPDDCNEMS